MPQKNLPEKIEEVRAAVVAIGFSPSQNQINIIGSGFFADGKIITVAHLLSNLSPEQTEKLMANVVVEDDIEKDFTRYQWIPIKLVPEKVDVKNDFAIFDIAEKPATLKELKLGDSDKVLVGQDAYFIGFPYAAQLINDGFGITLITNKTMISNIKRSGSDPAHPRNWFIVDAISNPGNSGCPLIDVETNEVIGMMSVSFRVPSHVVKDLDIREPMHISGAKPINLVKELLK